MRTAVTAFGCHLAAEGNAVPGIHLVPIGGIKYAGEKHALHKTEQKSLVPGVHVEQYVEGGGGEERSRVNCLQSIC